MSILALFWNLAGRFSAFLIAILAVSFSQISFIMLRYVPSIPTLVRVLIMNECWTLSNAFSASIDAPGAFGSSQDRGQIGAAAAHLHQSHSNTESEPHL